MSEEITAGQIRQVLDLELGENDSGQPTVRGYLLALLADVWRDGEGFDGKRPFGNSSRECDLYVPMVRAGLVAGSLDSDGYLERCDEKAANALIAAAIEALDAPREAPASEPAKVIVVTEIFTGRASVQRYDANGWTITDGTLFVNRDGRGVGVYRPHAWLSFREESVTTGPAGAGEASDRDGGEQ